MKVRLGRIRKALGAAGAAAAIAFGAGLGEGVPWQAALGMAGGAAVVAGVTTYAIPNRLSAAELGRLAREAAAREAARR